MKLDDWRKGLGLTYEQLGSRIGCGTARAFRLCRKGAIPRAAEMTAIRAATEGEVAPADFYPADAAAE